MTKEQLRPLTIEFLEDAAHGLRLVTQSNWSVECLGLTKTLANEASRSALDVPGVYLLVGPPEKADDNTHQDARLYVGQADSVADRLDGHLKSDSKKWWRTVVVIRRPEQKSPEPKPMQVSRIETAHTGFEGWRMCADQQKRSAACLFRGQ